MSFMPTPVRDLYHRGRDFSQLHSSEAASAWRDHHVIKLRGWNLASLFPVVPRWYQVLQVRAVSVSTLPLFLLCAPQAERWIDEPEP